MAISQNKLEELVQQLSQQNQALAAQNQHLAEQMQVMQSQMNQVRPALSQTPEALEKPPQTPQQASRSAIDATKPAEDVVYNNLNRSLDNLPSEQAKRAIHEKALRDGAAYGPEVIQAMEVKLQTGLSQYQKIQGYDPVVGGFIQNNVSTGAAFNKDGYAGQSTTVQQQIDILPKDAGVLYGNATLNQDNNLNVSGGNVGLNYAKVVRVGGTEVAAIANVNATIPAEGDFKANNVGYLAGAVVKAHEGKDNVNHTIAYVGNGAFDSHTILYRPSKEVFKDGTNTLTAYAPLTYTASEQTLENGQTEWKHSFGAKAGLRGDHNLGGGNSVYAQAEAGADDIASNPSFGGMFKVGFAWGGPDNKPSAPAHVAKNDAFEAPAPLPAAANLSANQSQVAAANALTSAPAHNSTHTQNDPFQEFKDAYNHFKTDRQKEVYVNQLAHNMQRHMGLDHQTAREMVEMNLGLDSQQHARQHHVIDGPSHG